jgi:sugar phosphate isomerase/epimerase
MHINDGCGLDDHLPPGSGEIDFKKIGRWVGHDTLKVIELESGTPDSEVASGINYLAQKMKL